MEKSKVVGLKNPVFIDSLVSDESSDGSESQHNYRSH